MLSINKVNNFNLIRLIAAIQVAFSHSVAHFGIRLHPLFTVVDLFPGVPIFFTVSGFLITNSFIKKPILKDYVINRSLRIFPGMWVCLLITILALIFFNIVNASNIFSFPFFVWVIGQLTCFQFYTPDMLRGWGVGTPNGSLWTTSVELQFYTLLPLIIILSRIRNKKLAVGGILAIFAVSVAFNQLYPILDHEAVAVKLFHVSILIYLHYFLIGVVICLLWEYMYKLFVGKVLWWLILFIIYVSIFYYHFQLYTVNYYPNVFGLISNLLLSFVVISFAFSARNLSSQILRDNDISYGIYIYHMVVVNTMLSLNFQSNQVLIALTSTFLLAFLSWKFVESPMLKLKGNKIFKKNLSKISFTQ